MAPPPKNIQAAIAKDREWLKRVLSEAKVTLIYPPTGQLMDAVTWAHVLDALDGDGP